MAFENVAEGTAAFNLADRLANTRKESRDDFTNNFNTGAKLGGMIGDITADVKFQGIIDKAEKEAKQQAEAQVQQRSQQSVGVLANQQNQVPASAEPVANQSFGVMAPNTGTSVPQGIQPTPTSTGISPPVQPAVNKVQEFINNPYTTEGKVNPLSPAVGDTRAQIVQRLIQEGKIPEGYGNKYLTNREQERNAFTSNLLKTQANLDALANSEVDSRTKALQATAALRALEDNNKYVLFQTLQTEGLEAAQKASDDLKLGFNLNNPKDLLGIEAGAKRSQLYFDSSKKTAEINKLQKEGNEVDTAGLPDGLFRMNGPTVYEIGPNGQHIPVTQERISQISITGKKAGAANTNISMGGMTKKFGENLGELDAKSFSADEDKARSAQKSYEYADNLEKLTSPRKDGKQIIAGPGSGLLRSYKRIFGGENDKEVLNNTALAVQNMGKLNLEGATAMKGQGQITEGERVLIEKANAGNIDINNPNEINALTKAVKKVQIATVKYFNERADQTDARYPGEGVGKRKMKVPGEIQTQSLDAKWGAK